MQTNRHRIAIAALMLLAAGSATAAIDLRNATVGQLDNGLTIILLEDRHFPVASVQMLYRVGARNEVTGKTGLAHFLEHMAFRDSRNFPDTGLVSRIYAVGGEWHGYTWTDQTTYFATVPRRHLDLLLRIEADRMQRLTLEEDDVAAERGAVLAEMHMYENSPGSMLIDTVNTLSFLAHPYRNNTIGWQSDVESLSHRDVVDFYAAHYHPANAVLAVVGDFDRTAVEARIRELFGSIRRRPATPLPHTAEPLQNGVRRATLHGETGEPRFAIAYRAPSVHHRDYAAFLVLQELLGAGSGVNFLQNDWGTPVGDDAPLAAAADGVTTWFPPSDQDYVFMIGGFAPDDMKQSAVERRIEACVTRLREEPAADVPDAVGKVLDELTFDVETTEDAAHQLAFFGGLRALDVLFDLPQHVAAVTPDDVRRVANTWLLPQRRSIAWYQPSYVVSADGDLPDSDSRTLPDPTPRRPVGVDPVPAAVSVRLDGGIPAIVQPSTMSATAELRIVLASTGLAGTSANDPIAGYSSLTARVRPSGLDNAIRAARDALDSLSPDAAVSVIPAADPAVRLEQVFDAVIGSGRSTVPATKAPVLVAVAGDVAPEDTIALLERTFGDLPLPPAAATPRAADVPPADTVVHVGASVAQAQLGYIVPAPPPGSQDADAWRMLLYILSHEYEGRLGKKAISDAGLAYYIDGRYRSDGTNAWITLSTGVDPENVEPLRTLLAEELGRLRREPPTVAEIHEAREHMLGRLSSEAQSNAELTSRLAANWLWYGEPVTAEALQRRLQSVTREDLVDIAPAFAAGATILVTE